MQQSLGICIGASTVSFVKSLQHDDGRISIISNQTLAHHGNPKLILTEYFKQKDIFYYSIVTTGRKFKDLLNTPSISEPEAIEESLKFLKLANRYNAIASLGGENFLIYGLSPDGTITNALTGNKCASGTGEFFLQQIRRIDLDIEHAVALAQESAPYIVSGRCSVFCKSDCTHALNKGVPKGEVVAGLSKMIANKIIGLLRKQKAQNILVIGGLSQNSSVINFLKDTYPNIIVPKEAAYFEALGASLFGLKITARISENEVFRNEGLPFSFLEPLSKGIANVTFKSISRGKAAQGDECIIGLDVGSTTTKAVIIRKADDTIAGSVYLRTNGDPVGTSINCYKELLNQVSNGITIIGLGVTGSGRQIAGLHALTNGVINEIIAHATAATYFDKEVDTIFEIGGQDAKYTYLTNGIASDYAMNEACSAGTGSFLEESAKETLNIDFREISDIALKTKRPPNFNDQCAAFIQSDIKNALQESLDKEDVVAGLVYSICMNYNNRVKGNRPVGKKVFMQGGVCYNQAVPIAMSMLINKEIIVPPEPGLMGAFGVALEVKKRIQLGLLKKQEFMLNELIMRELKYEKSFFCQGKIENCDRKCEIAVININGQRYPFGGACSKYFNQRLSVATRQENIDYIKIRQDLVFKKYAALPPGQGKTIGIVKSFMTNTLYPLYYNFFTKLGLKVILSNNVEKEGIDKVQAAFCFPAEIAHGHFQNLINQKTDYIFLTHIIEMENNNEKNYKRPCVLVQGESYYLRASFKDEVRQNIIQLTINYNVKEKEIEEKFIEIAKILGKKDYEGRAAYRFAAEQQKQMSKEFQGLGLKIINDLENDQNKIAMVLFGRSYNAFVEEANMGIPHKFASKGIAVIPHDFLPSDNLESYENMYWFTGQQILRSARFVTAHKQLFATFITNFSCGPDSFIIDYFRKIMGEKPSLTLELDSHSMDVGIDTRIDAALDIIKNYIELRKAKIPMQNMDNFKALEVVYGQRKIHVIDSKGKIFDIKSKEVEVIIPFLDHLGSPAFAAALRAIGIKSFVLPISNIKTLKYGRNCASCKECLPFILTTGSMMEYLNEKKDHNKKTLFFMPTGGGPCRQGQYIIKLKDIINDLKLEDIGILTLLDENGYVGLGLKFLIRSWLAIITSDVAQDIENVILALAINKAEEVKIFEDEWEKVVKAIETKSIFQFYRQLKHFTKKLAAINLKRPLEKAKTVLLTGEAYVRKDEFSRMDLISRLTERGFVVKIAPLSEYVYYCNYLVNSGSGGIRISKKDQIIISLVARIELLMERKIKKILSGSGLTNYKLVEVEKTIKNARHLISDKLLGEAILTVGLSIREIIDEVCGVITIGPFACMPSRLAEAILNQEMNLEDKRRSSGKFKIMDVLNGKTPLPYLHIETDGNSFPQLVQAKIEIFMLQAERFHELIKNETSTS